MDENVRITCSDCVTKMYPNKGKFTKKDLKEKELVKKRFGNEYGGADHIWVKIISISSDGIWGTVDNVPYLEASPEFGTHVMVKWEEIEDVC